MVTKALGVKGGVDQHALYAGAVQPAGGGGTGSSSRGKNKRGVRHKGVRQQQQLFQQQFSPAAAAAAAEQHGHPKHNRWDNSGPNPFGTGGQVPAMGWVPTDPPPGVMPPMPPLPVGNPTGWRPPPNPEPLGHEGVCYRYHRPSHYVAECTISPAHMNVGVPFTAQQHPHPMHYGGGWVQESPPGSDGYTSAPQPLANNSHEQKNDGSCAPTSNPHIIAAQFTRKGKHGRSGIFRGNRREQWVADSGTTFNETGNSVGMVDGKPSRSTLV